MDIQRKLEILADAAKYDAACTSSGAKRGAQKGKLGSTLTAGCCHSFSADGRCVTLLKVLMTNVCIYDCAYCVNRASNDVERTAFTPRELAELTVAFYRRNCIEGLFLSSGVIGSPDRTTELMIETLRLLREDYAFNGYIHAKAVPGTSPELIDELGRLSDRLSVNLELPSQESLRLLAPQKSGRQIVEPMRRISDNIAADKEGRALARRGDASLARTGTAGRGRGRAGGGAQGGGRAFAPAGQATQMIIGATPESDYQILKLTSALYQRFSLKRVFFSAYLPVNEDPRLPAGGVAQRLDREHRLYQADWLLRSYGYGVDEIIDAEDPFLDTEVDPKVNWALKHLDFFPVEVNKAPYEVLLRVPGIGVRGAKSILKARRTATLREPELRKLGIAYKRARFFITCNGAYAGQGVEFTPEALRAQLAAPIKGGKHGRRADRVLPGQMSLFENEVGDGAAALAEGAAGDGAGGSGRALEGGAGAKGLAAGKTPDEKARKKGHERASGRGTTGGRDAGSDKRIDEALTLWDALEEEDGDRGDGGRDGRDAHGLRDGHGGRGTRGEASAKREEVVA